jgi:hypothetical protein
VIGSWPSPQGGEEYALTFDRDRGRRLLVLPALFDEHNKLRHFTVEVMRRLDAAGIDTFLPDLPGCNESLAPLEAQTLASWREAAQAVGDHFGVTHVLTLRGGALLAPDLAGWAFAPIAGQPLLNALMRARILASREAGRDETREALLEAGVYEGLELAGLRLGAQMVSELWRAHPGGALIEIAQSNIGGGALWLRAEPAHDPAQADGLTALIAESLV